MLAPYPALVDLAKEVPGLVLDVRYATADNFLGKPLYPYAAAYLRKPAAEKLKKAALRLEKDGYRLIVHDAYRPMSVQKEMWAAKPDPRFVANPANGSQHNRGAAVDVSLADASGKPLGMPSAFDEFEGGAKKNAHSEILRAAMVAAGFKPISEEWWHYSDPEGKAWPLLDTPFEALRK